MKSFSDRKEKICADVSPQSGIPAPPGFNLHDGSYLRAVPVLVLALYPGFPRCAIMTNMQKEKGNPHKRNNAIFNARSLACNKIKSVKMREQSVS